MLKFLEIKNAKDKNEIYIYGDIVDDSWRLWRNFGFDDDESDNPDTYPLDIKNMLDGFDGKPVDVHINSGGGHAFAGLAIANMLKNYEGSTVAYVDGEAASAASLIALACDLVIMPEGSMLMIHNPMGECSGNANDMLRAAESLDASANAFAEFYQKVAVDGISVDDIKKMMDTETWFNTTKAVATFKTIQTTKGLQAVAYAGSTLLEKYKNVPKALTAGIAADKNKQKAAGQKAAEIERMKQELDIALAL